MATRFYFPSNKPIGNATPPLTPAFDASWDTVANAIRRKLRRPGQGTTSILDSGSVAGGGVSGGDVLAGQFISDPLRGQTISGTVKGMLQPQEPVATDNYNPAFIARIVSGDGSVSRGTLLSALGGGTEFSVAGSPGSLKYPPGWTGVGAVLTPVDAQEGDRLVIEVGFRQTSTSVGIADFFWTEDQTTDLSETEGVTSLFNGWVEFSQDIYFREPIRNPLLEMYNR